jgi:hypothetical protein
MKIMQNNPFAPLLLLQSQFILPPPLQQHSQHSQHLQHSPQWQSLSPTQNDVNKWKPQYKNNKFNNTIELYKKLNISFFLLFLILLAFKMLCSSLKLLLLLLYVETF